jgi:hypothetical protein
MPTIEFNVDSDVPADRVFAAITDFTDRRPDLWPGISRKFYEVHSTGENWAEATEGSDVLGGVWAKERYEWSPGKVKATVMDSNIFESGVWELRVSPQGGGSHVEVVNQRRFKGARGKLLAAVVRVAGPRVLKKDFEKTLAILREEGEPKDAG